MTGSTYLPAETPMLPTSRTRIRSRAAAVVTVLLPLVAATAVAATPAGAHADTLPGHGPVLAHTVGGDPQYDYSPTAIEVGDTQYFYWCGYGNNVNADNHRDDAIWMATYDTVTHVTSAPREVLDPSTTKHTWDDTHVCNPSVVMGRFDDPVDDGKTYAIALYYVGFASDGHFNRLGVAFSNDWVHFVKHRGPILSPPDDCWTTVKGQRRDYYGVGQPSTYNADGGSRIEIANLYHCGSPRYDWHSTNDGVGVSAVPNHVTTAGLRDEGPWKGPVGDAAFAFDQRTGTWYAAVEPWGAERRRPDPAAPNDPTKDHVDRESWTFTLYRNADKPWLGSWNQLTTVDTNRTGFEVNQIPTIVRDRYGNLAPSAYPDVQLAFAVSNPKPPASSTQLADIDGSIFGHWDVVPLLWRHDAPTLPFRRYRSSSAGTYEVTTGYVDTGFFDAAQGTLGSLYEAPTGAATLALYGCRADGADYAVSDDPGCSGRKVLGLEGYAYPPSYGRGVPLYRCSNAAGTVHLVSTEPGCEGYHTDKLLGYAQS